VLGLPLKKPHSHVFSVILGHVTPDFWLFFFVGCLENGMPGSMFCFVFLGQFFDVVKVVIIHPSSDLAKFGYKLNMKVHYI
jgi:hypothetical protein